VMGSKVPGKTAMTGCGMAKTVGVASEAEAGIMPPCA